MCQVHSPPALQALPTSGMQIVASAPACRPLRLDGACLVHVACLRRCCGQPHACDSWHLLRSIRVSAACGVEHDTSCPFHESHVSDVSWQSCSTSCARCGATCASVDLPGLGYSPKSKFVSGRRNDLDFPGLLRSTFYVLHVIGGDVRQISGRAKELLHRCNM